MKFISTIIAGAIVGALGVYFTLDWQEENLKFSLTPPAKFGDINYQNLTIRNSGWNPAINVKIYIDDPEIGFTNIKSSAPLRAITNEKNGVASTERVRRDESLVISIAYEGRPLFGNDIRVVSDRSIAQQVEVEDKNPLPLWATLLLWLLGGQFVISFLAAILIPAYKDYVKRAKEYEQKGA